MSTKDTAPSNCCSRIVYLLKLYHSSRVDFSNDRSEISLIMVPEAFRIWYYILFWMVIFLGMFVTLMWSDLDLDDNPVKDAFGANNLCIFVDDPPFTFFGAALYVIVTLFILIYLFLDNMRVYCNYRDAQYGITKGWYTIYTIFTVWHFIGFIWFVQIFATGPTESLEIHYSGYMALQYAFWTLAVVHFVYFMKIGIIKTNTFYHIVGIIYLIIMVIVIIIKTVLNVPNTFGAKLYLKYPITMLISDIETPIFTFLVMICPFIIYLIFLRDLDHIELKFTLKSGYKYQLTPSVIDNKNPIAINEPKKDDENRGLLHMHAISNESRDLNAFRTKNSITVDAISEIFTDKKVRDDFWPKLRASCIIIIGFPFFIYFLDKYLELKGIQIIGILLVMLHAYFFIVCYVSWFRAEGLYRLQALYTVPSQWAHYPVPYKMVQVRNEAIRSISEFSAIRGTIPHLALLGIGIINFGIYLPLFLSISAEWRVNSDFYDKWASILCCGGPAGMMWLGTWELKPHDKCHKIMHYIGVLMGLCSNIGLAFAMRWHYISWLVMAPAIIGFILWNYFDFTAKMPSDDPKYVTQISLKCLVSESIVVLSSAAAFDIYLLYAHNHPYTHN